MIAVSMLLIAASAVALGFGWITANESLIWASIVATGAAAILLALAYYLSIRAAGAPVDGDAFLKDPAPSPAADPPSSDAPPPETQEFGALAEDDAGEDARRDDDRGGADEEDDSESPDEADAPKS